MLAFSLQTSGGGLYVEEGGLANLDGCNVFSNEAYVCPPYAPSLSLLQRPAGTLRVLAFCRALVVGSPSTLAARPILMVARCTKTSLTMYVLTFCPFSDLSSSAPLERFVCSPLQSYGGGLIIYGTATLIDSKIYSNEANVGNF